MPKAIPSQELNAIVQMLRQYPEGLSLANVAPHFINIPKRTLQRRLAYLIHNGALQKKGYGKSLRYFTSYHLQEEMKSHTVQNNKIIHYQQNFLEQYQPNKTHYLSENLRKHLHITGTPVQQVYPTGIYAREIFDRLLTDIAWNSSRLEGNTYSLLETEHLLTTDTIAHNKTRAETQMLLNHKRALEFLVNFAAEIVFNRYTIVNLHALVTENLATNPILNVSNTCFEKMLTKANAIHDPFEQAFFVMVQLPYLQPFTKMNKCVSRFAANIPLIKHNYCPLSFLDVADQIYHESLLAVEEHNHIEPLRDLFVWTYERSALRYSHTVNEPDTFRLRYHAQIMETVNAAVKHIMDKKNAAIFAEQQAVLHIPQTDRARYIEIVETELLALHIGNIARYYLQPAEFERWHQFW